ncbi:MAG TPA: bifunctional phosphoribosylaminoimidazolecarboxamide formyltransferase/IMP cyclohydrolase [Bryobacteraceae bacterium]|nr:bifunctional phosphoribosylaminoimidazolecarboxamide formyltransferase/IMP cyclohydrolase [Bryobacteraceae bacterium]
MPKLQRALISVTDKTGITDFAAGLVALGVEILSTGGTAKLLRDAGLAVRDVSEVTGFPEMLDGRVKTLHPRIAAGILAVRSKPEHLHALEQHGIPTIDLVVVNLYAFEQTAARSDVPVCELIEQIDIGGPTLIRAAAKNYADVAVIVSPEDYGPVLEELRSSGELSLATRWRLAQKAFRRTADYDRAISARLERITVESGSFIERPHSLPEVLDVRVPRALSLRYGENPHQQGALYSDRRTGIAGAWQLQGKELSYNNLADLDAAWQLAVEFDGPATAIIKHTNPCGCAESASLAESYRQALACDPVSAFGGVVGFNRTVDEETASELVKTFLEAIAAPDYTGGALAILSAKKNLRLLKVTEAGGDALLIKSISGGLLVQTPDTARLDRNEARVVTERAPTPEEWTALEFAWKVVKHVKSNAVVFARAGQTVGIGAGQMSRVDAVKVAAMKAMLPLAGTVLASDAFFPFPDGVEEAARHGATAVIQPGGSVKDAEVIAAANRLGLAMVLTGIRHFRH